MSERVVIYTTKICPDCVRAKSLLSERKIAFREVSVDNDEAERRRLVEVTGRKTVPQIFIDDRPIGGCDDLYALDRSGQLTTLLGAGAPLEAV